MDSQAIAQWAEQKTAPKSNTDKQHRLSDTDKALALQYHRDGITQVEIAKRLGVTQPAISQWISKCRDTADAAGLYLRGSALRMAKNVVKNGQARDHIQALKGIGVLEADRSDIHIAVGVSLPGLPIQSQAVVSVSPLSPQAESAND